MKTHRIFALAMMVALLAALMAPTTAFAAKKNYWDHLGGFPLVKGGAKTATKAINLELNNQHVRRGTRRVIAANHQPGWLMGAIDERLQDGHIFRIKIRRGINLNNMTYGYPREFLMHNTIWRGKISKIYWLDCWATDVSRTETVKEGSRTFSVTTTYRWYMAKACANVFVRFISTKKVEITPPPVVPCPSFYIHIQKLQDCTSGPRLAGWPIDGTVTRPIGPLDQGVITRADDWVTVGPFPTNTPYSFNELAALAARPDWEAVAPTVLAGVVPDHDVYLTFVNRKIPPPPVVHLLCVAGSAEFSCMNPCSVDATLTAIVVHSDDDLVTLTYKVNNEVVKTTNSLLVVVHDLPYGRPFTITVTAKDAAGHTANDTHYYPAIDPPATSSPPPPPD